MTDRLYYYILLDLWTPRAPRSPCLEPFSEVMFLITALNPLYAFLYLITGENPPSRYLRGSRPLKLCSTPHPPLAHISLYLYLFLSSLSPHPRAHPVPPSPPHSCRRTCLLKGVVPCSRTRHPRLATTTAQDPQHSHSVSLVSVESRRGVAAISTSVRP